MKISKKITSINTNIYLHLAFVFRFIDLATSKNILPVISFIKQKISVFNLHPVWVLGKVIIWNFLLPGSRFNQSNLLTNKKLDKAILKNTELNHALVEEIDKATQIDMALSAALKEQRARVLEKKYELEQLKKELLLLKVTPEIICNPVSSSEIYGGATRVLASNPPIHSYSGKNLVKLLFSVNIKTETAIEDCQANRLQAEKVLKEWENQVENSQTSFVLKNNNKFMR